MELARSLRMDCLYTPTIFTRFNLPLRAVLIDDEPWFAACDFCRLIGHRHPERVVRRVDEDQRQDALLSLGEGADSVTLISESGAYRAIYHFQHPENRHLRQWLTRDVIPALRDEAATAAWKPTHTLMSFEGARLLLLQWRGDLWVRLQEIPHFSQVPDDAPRRGLGRWLRR